MPISTQDKINKQIQVNVEESISKFVDKRTDYQNSPTSQEALEEHLSNIESGTTKLQISDDIMSITKQIWKENKLPGDYQNTDDNIE